MNQPRVLICGDRNWNDYDMILGFVSSLPENSVIVQGECRGADLMGKKAGKANNLEVLEFPADWSGPAKKAAGPIRNAQMLREGKPTHVVAYHNDLKNSKGTKHMVSISQKAQVPTFLNAKHWNDVLSGVSEIKAQTPKPKEKEKEIELFD